MPKPIHKEMFVCAYVDGPIVKRMKDYCALQKRSFSSFIRLIFGAVNWGSCEHDHIVLPISKALTKEPDELRAALLSAVDRIVEHYE
jgi:hypothetical protein